MIRLPAACLAASLILPGVLGAAEPGPGAYCPLPKAGEKPKCLVGVEEEFGEFFEDLEDGEVSDEVAARLEEEVSSGVRGTRPYLALSTLAHGYYRLSQRATAAAEDDALKARLVRWNAVLTRAYAAAGSDEAYRASVRGAALDLKENAPQVALLCSDEAGEAVPCGSTDELVRAIDDLHDRTGIRGALGRLIERVIGSDGDS